MNRRGELNVKKYSKWRNESFGLLCPHNSCAIPRPKMVIRQLWANVQVVHLFCLLLDNFWKSKGTDYRHTHLGRMNQQQTRWPNLEMLLTFLFWAIVHFTLLWLPCCWRILPKKTNCKGANLGSTESCLCMHISRDTFAVENPKMLCVTAWRRRL